MSDTRTKCISNPDGTCRPNADVFAQLLYNRVQDGEGK